MRAFIGAVAVLAFVGFVGAADEKIDGKKLVGKWEQAEGSAPVTIEFTDKGKAILSFDLGEKSEKIEGTYKLDGNRLDITLSIGGKEQKETINITKLTDDEWVGKGTADKEKKFKKVKAKI